MRNSVQRIEIVIGRNKRQETKLNGDGMGKHQRTIAKDKDPAEVGQQPKPNMICYFAGFQITLLSYKSKQKQPI